ncbi:hypothetical protein KOW79_004586 [Hemibagrus wyckioides]|uniref:Uncharacterized protein n=1 Tax=Hemibagrus wyckioides TaxID=337641 RepID=A0A9D3SQF8_9TELE|nr:hypothetical protein KOW79_004586 [Hemibagrus wyckioides]
MRRLIFQDRTKASNPSDMSADILLPSLSSSEHGLARSTELGPATHCELRGVVGAWSLDGDTGINGVIFVPAPLDYTPWTPL